MAKQAANQSGAFEALMVDAKGLVTEAGSSSFFFVKDNVSMCGRSARNLHGITRRQCFAWLKIVVFH